MDAVIGACVLSTEEVVIGIVRAEMHVNHALWLGVTDGVYDDEGLVIEKINSESAAHVSGAPGAVNVIGGISHRVESAIELSKLSVSSYIANGIQEELVNHYLNGKTIKGIAVYLN